MAQTKGVQSRDAPPSSSKLRPPSPSVVIRVERKTNSDNHLQSYDGAVEGDEGDAEGRSQEQAQDPDPTKTTELDDEAAKPAAATSTTHSRTRTRSPSTSSDSSSEYSTSSSSSYLSSPSAGSSSPAPTPTTTYAPPPGVHHYTSPHELPPSLRKYFWQRHSLLPFYDDPHPAHPHAGGAWLTRSSWFELTPAPIAQRIAAHVATAAPKHKHTVVDLFAGVGMNSVAFALQQADGGGGGGGAAAEEGGEEEGSRARKRRRVDDDDDEGSAAAAAVNKEEAGKRFRHVVAVDRDPLALACARHNAAIRGVSPSRITWTERDAFAFTSAAAASYKNAYPPSEASHNNNNPYVVFASPPWGGPAYNANPVFDLESTDPETGMGGGTCTLKRMVGEFRALAEEVVLYLPRTSDLRQVARCVAEMEAEEEGEGKGKRRKKMKKVRVIHYCMDGASKALCVYFGDWDWSKVDADEAGGGW